MLNDHTLTKTAGGSGDGTTMVTTKAEDAGQVDGSVEYPQDLLLGSDSFAPSSLYFSQVDGDPGDEEEETGTFCHQTKCPTRFSSTPLCDQQPGGVWEKTHSSGAGNHILHKLAFFQT